ncbi:hypothetical protein Tco_0024658 [Tanacetum coccineum]
MSMFILFRRQRRNSGKVESELLLEKGVLEKISTSRSLIIKTEVHLWLREQWDGYDQPSAENGHGLERIFPKARAIEKKVRKMEFGTRFGMAPEFSGVVSHSREALARTMECREALAPTTECNSGAKHRFADVAPLFLYGTRSLGRPLPKEKRCGDLVGKR